MSEDGEKQVDHAEEPKAQDAADYTSLEAVAEAEIAEPEKDKSKGDEAKDAKQNEKENTMSEKVKEAEQKNKEDTKSDETKEASPNGNEENKSEETNAEAVNGKY